MRVSVYLVEKETGLIDENGVKLYYTVIVRLTRQAAEEAASMAGTAVRIRKLIATK